MQNHDLNLDMGLDLVQEITSDVTRPMTLFERFENLASATYSPFGLAFRPSRFDMHKPDFACWDYRPAYLPKELSIQAARNTPLQEPLLFYLRFAKRQNETAGVSRQEPTTHPVGWRDLTRLVVTATVRQSLSAAAQQINAAGTCVITPGEHPLMELEFDHSQQNQVIDFRPSLPLLCRW